MQREKRDSRIATRAVGKRWGFGEMRPLGEDANGAGREEASDAGVGEEADVECGIIVVRTVWISAWMG